MKNKFLVIHGHFYQPPRQNPWLGIIEKEISASPYHNWNRRITDECYGPNSLKKVQLKGKDELVSNYSLINFNFGPTLFSWIEEHYPALFVSILEADRISAALFGRGGAIAQTYSHSIMPLLTAEDKKLNIKWGKEYFAAKFHRQTEGMWLAETAVDEASLEALAAQEIKFTILAPRQAKAFKLRGEKEFSQAEGVLDTSRPYLWRSKEAPGKTLVIFFYDSGLAGKMISELENPEKYHLRIFSAFRPDSATEIISLAADGETFGHHLKGGDAALSAMLFKTLKDKKPTLTNFASFLDIFKPEDEIEIKENTSWSCEHGIGRWKEDCGCRYRKDFNQKWRSILRKEFDLTGGKIDSVYTDEAVKYFSEPEKIFEDYVSQSAGSSPEERLKFINAGARKTLKPDEVRTALSLLEMKRGKLLMNTSCGWFFDDITNPETLLVLKQCLKTCEVASNFGADFSESLKNLGEIKSNNRTLNFFGMLLKISKEEAYDLKKISAETAISHFLGYFQPFECHIRLRARILKEKTGENKAFYLSSCTDADTLAQEEFFCAVEKKGKDISYFIKKSSSDLWDEDLEKVSSGDLSGLEKGSLSDFRPEKREIFSIYLKNDEKSRKLVSYLGKLKMLSPGADFAAELGKEIERLLSRGFKEEEIPFLYEAFKYLAAEAAAMPDEKSSIKNLDLISKSRFSALLWKNELLKSGKTSGIKL